MHLAQMLDRNVVCCDRSGTIAIEHLKIDEMIEMIPTDTTNYTTNPTSNTGP
jgi:hypothetical protein